MDYQYRLDFKVRDYECDIQGIVNNGVYMNYLEHARLEFLLEQGVDFAALAKQNINLVVIKAELEYKNSLTSGDNFWVALNMRKISKLKFAFDQTIYHAKDEKLILNACITGLALNEKGRPFVSDLVNRLIG